MCVFFQFMTVAADGLVLVWDLRFEEHAMAAMRRKGGNPDEKKGDATEVLWQPLYKLVATKPTGVGELPLYCVSLRPADGTGTARFALSTEDGEIALVEMVGRDGGAGKSARNATKADDGAEEGGGGDSLSEASGPVKFLSSDHFRPCVDLQVRLSRLSRLSCLSRLSRSSRFLTTITVITSITVIASITSSTALTVVVYSLYELGFKCAFGACTSLRVSVSICQAC